MISFTDKEIKSGEVRLLQDSVVWCGVIQQVGKEFDIQVSFFPLKGCVFRNVAVDCNSCVSACQFNLGIFLGLPEIIAMAFIPN